LDRMWGLIGIILCAAIVFFSNSGGPISAVVVGLAGWFLWPMRTKMHLTRRGMLGLVLLFASIMNAPIWYIPAKFSDLTGGDGWHRSYLMDMAARDFGKWWFSGMSVAETAHWFPYTLRVTGGADITNQFLSFGLAAGALSMIILILLLINCYKSLGEAMTIIRSSFSKPTETEYLLWGLGVMLAVHIENWFGISYFDQTYVLWFMQLAAIVNISQICSQPYSSSALRVGSVQFATSQ
jgi:hypothetical protein